MSDKLNAKINVLQGKDELITSYYGKRIDPVTGKTQSEHLGIDLISECGNRTVIAFADGVVTATRNTYSGRTTDGSAGNYIRIQHADGKYTLYKHLKQNTIKVKKGQTVKAGQELATMGDTGHATGVHLHFDVEIGGKRVDPLPYLRGEKELIEKKKLFGNRGDNPKIVWGTKYNKDVQDFQALMKQLKKYGGSVDGIAGNYTLKAAKNYTIANCVDGNVSKWVQRRLKSLGYYDGLVDGKPRSLTEKSIVLLEKDYGLTQNGEVSNNDWYYLLAVE